MNIYEVLVVSTIIAIILSWFVTVASDVLIVKVKKLQELALPGKDERDEGNGWAKAIFKQAKAGERIGAPMLQAAATVVQAQAIVDAARLIRGVIFFAAILSVTAPAVAKFF